MMQPLRQEQHSLSWTRQTPSVPRHTSQLRSGKRLLHRLKPPKQGGPDFREESDEHHYDGNGAVDEDATDEFTVPVDLARAGSPYTAQDRVTLETHEHVEDDQGREA